MSTRDRLFAEKCKPAECGEYGTFHVRIIDGIQMAAHQKRIREYTAPEATTTELDVYAGLVCVAACTEAGDRIFKDDEIEAVKKMPHVLLSKLFDAIRAYNFPPLEESKKNSDATEKQTSN